MDDTAQGSRRPSSRSSLSSRRTSRDSQDSDVQDLLETELTSHNRITNNNNNGDANEEAAKDDSPAPIKTKPAVPPKPAERKGYDCFQMI